MHVYNLCFLRTTEIIYHSVFSLESGEGRYSFQFAENITIHQFLYSRFIFKRKNLHTYKALLREGSNKGVVLQESTSDTLLVRPDKNFEGCLNFYNSNIVMKHQGQVTNDTYIRCIIFNGDSKDSRRCEFQWIAARNVFKITLNRTDFVSTKVDQFKKYGILPEDVFGGIRCILNDDQHYRAVLFDLPFVSRRQNVATTSTVATPNVNHPSLTSVLLFLSATVAVFGFLIFIWNYQRRKKRLARAKDKIWRWVSCIKRQMDIIVNLFWFLLFNILPQYFII